MCDNVWADVCCIRYVEHFSDLFCHVRRKLKKMNTVYLWVAIILTDNQLPFLFSEPINTAQKERGIRND